MKDYLQQVVVEEIQQQPLELYNTKIFEMFPTNIYLNIIKRILTF